MRHKEHNMMLPLAPMAGMPSNVLDQTGLRVARCDFDGQWQPACDANAAYIIKCVNEHERLEAALRASNELLHSLNALVDHLPRWQEVEAQIAANEAALGGAK